MKDAGAGKTGKKPVEPTERNFSIGPIEIRNSVGFGPQFVFSKDKTDKKNPRFNYMMEVVPGTYLYHGPVLNIPGTPATGVCYCLGSVKFEVKKGEIVDLGNFLTNAPAMDNGGTAIVGTMLLQKSAPNSKQIGWLKNPVAFGLPESLSGHNGAKVELEPSGKMNNVYRAMVSRMGPVDGLFRYERDQAIDLRVKLAEEEASSVTIEPEESSPEQGSSEM